MLLAAAMTWVVVLVPTVERSTSNVNPPATVTKLATVKLTEPVTCVTFAPLSNDKLEVPVSVFTVCVIGVPKRLTRSRNEPSSDSPLTPSSDPSPLPSIANFAGELMGTSTTAASVPLLNRTPTAPSPAKAVTPVAPIKKRSPERSNDTSPLISAKSWTLMVTPPAIRITSAPVKNDRATLPFGV